VFKRCFQILCPVSHPVTFFWRVESLAFHRAQLSFVSRPCNCLLNTRKSTPFWRVIPCALLEDNRLTSLCGRRVYLANKQRFGQIFQAEIRGSAILRNVSKLLPHYTLSHARNGNIWALHGGDRICSPVVRVLAGCRLRGPGFQSRRYRIFWVAVGL
jgi:hypothetical protein